MKTAIYCRVSTSNQTNDRQQSELLEYCEKNNIKVDNKHIYVDVISGFSDFDSREAYSLMMNDVNKGKIDTILFSEFTRCSRNAVELQQMIKEFQSKNVDLFFQKQNLWVRANNDLGSQILIAVLAVVSSYEVELFAARAQGGRIIKAKKGNHNIGGYAPYGYSIVNKELVINKEEATIVRLIFKLYTEGKSSNDIANYLNANNIPTAYYTRTNGNSNNRWQPARIVGLVHRTIYIGVRSFVFHDPDPTKKQTKKNILEEIETKDESLRIIDDELFFQVEKLLIKKRTKNPEIRNPNFLKEKIKCGACGGNAMVAYQRNNNNVYKCAGGRKTKFIKNTCENMSQYSQRYIDGLVLQLSLKMFSEINLQEITSEKIEQNQKEILELKNNLIIKELEQKNNADKYKKLVKRLLVIDNDNEFDVLIQEEKTKFENEKNKIISDIEKIKSSITRLNNINRSLKNLSKNNNFHQNQHILRQNKDLLKQMVNQYIDVINIHKVGKYALIIVKYTTGTELWGTIKLAKYRANEMFFDEIYCHYGQEYISWYVDNSNQEYRYNKDNMTVSYQDNEYTFEEFSEKLREENSLISYPLFTYYISDKK